jgi:uncharacterized protein YxeA
MKDELRPSTSRSISTARNASGSAAIWASTIPRISDSWACCSGPGMADSISSKPVIRDIVSPAAAQRSTTFKEENTMKKLALGILALALAIPLSAATWKNVSVMDTNCAAKEKFMANPDAHDKACALQCSKAGYGAVVDGKFVKFDAKGNDLAQAALKKSDKKDHIRATVDGELKDGVIRVTSLKLD